LKIRRFAGLAATLAVGSLVLTACGSGDDNSSQNPSSSAASGPSAGIITANSSEPANPIIPTNTNEVGGGKIETLIFAGLVYYDADGNPHNEVADSIETTDSQNYTIKIKSGWKFSNGEAVTAKSFVDAWSYGAKFSNAQLAAYFFDPIEGFSYEKDQPLTGLKVVDDTTFTVKLVQPQADFPLRLGYAAFYPLPESAYADMKAFGENPVGNGPYKLDGPGAWEHNQQIKLVPNADYAGDRKAQNGGVTLKFYTTQDSAYNDLLSDQLDVLDAVPDSAFATFQEELGDRAVNQPAAVFQSFTIAQWLPHFEGEEGKLRRAAISHAINREQITKTIFRDTRTPASDFTSPVIAGWSDTVPGSEVLTYDADKAKQLWAQADAISKWDGKFTIAYNTDGGHKAWVDAVTNGLSSVLGIQAEGQPYAVFADLRKDVEAGKKGEKNGLTGAARSGWQADYPSLFNFLGPLYATGASSNDGNYTNKDVDALLTKGSAETSVDAANADFQKVQEQLFKDLPAIPLWYSNVTGGSSTLVKDVKFGWDSVPMYYAITKK
jgi:oligopeptide transport system substrate-binding protein